MFKSSFAKYLTAFVIIILVSFLMLSGIITSMIRTHVTLKKEETLRNSCEIIADSFEKDSGGDLAAYIHRQHVETLVRVVDYDFKILVIDPTGKVLLSTYSTDDGTPLYHDQRDLGYVAISAFDEEIVNDTKFLVYKGELQGITEDKDRCIAYCKSIGSDDAPRGYVITLASTTHEDVLISVARKTVINSSIWVMLAAVIAAYFITERIVHPLKNMTRAAKSFGKGDFSERINVNGHDEVAELALAFNNMAESLENLESMRNSFLANVSHDLRTPMTTISGFIDGIISGAIPEDQHEHYLGVISGEVHRLSRLVNQLLDISRLESGDRKFNFTNFDVAEVSRLILLSFEQKIDQKHLDVEFYSEEDAMSVNADKDAIYQIIYNLCHNAIKFSSEGGKFVINIRRIPGKKIKVSIYDQGQVISPEDAKHIFDRFYKTDKSRGLDKSGVGLGLYICKTIVDAHGEKISHEPHEDGCEFWFTLKEGEPLTKHKS